jgi:AraC-like DNA-binding protein
LIEASRLLSEKPDARITEIAYLIGFKNISYFNKLFKEQFG